MKRFLSYRRQLHLFLLPYLLGSILLTLLPALATTAVAFTRYNALQPPQWVGLNNFARLLDSPMVRISLYSSLVFLALAVPLRLFAALALALLMQQKRRFFGFYRAAVYLPTLIPETAYALIWLWIFNPLYGPLNLALAWLGFPTPAWLTDPQAARFAIVLMLLLQIGEGFVVLLAGLQQIPRAVYEAAHVDGADGWRSFFYITLPLLTPWLLLLTFRDLIMSLQNSFTPTFVLTYGGPYYATTFVPLLVYEVGFDLFDFGLAAAILVVLYLFLLLLILGTLSSAREVMGLYEE